ncbi:MAG: CPBP family intramembrane glutamic endopeptidase [Chitinispirillaceae bacterium]
MVENHENELKQLKEQLSQMDIHEVRRLLHQTDKENQPRRYNLLKDHLYNMEEIREGLQGRKQTPPQKYPALGNALLLLLLLIVIQLGVTSTAQWLLSRAGVAISNTIDLVVAGVANLLAFAAVILYGLRKTDTGNGTALFAHSFSPYTIIPVLVSVAGLSIIGSEIDNLIRHLLPPPEAIQRIMQDMADAGPAGMFTLVVVAPFTEELLFRGLFLRGFERNYGRKGAIFTAALLFALIHLNPYQMIPAFLAGLFLGWITLGSGSVWPAIIAHAATNGMLLFVTWLNPDIPGVIHREQLEYHPLWLDAAGVVLLVAGILWLGKEFHGEERVGKSHFVDTP